MRNICVVNRYYPPNPGVAGEAACDLVRYLLQAFPEATVSVIHIDAPYLFEGISPVKPVGNVVCMKTAFGGSRNLYIRFFRNLIEGYRLMKKALEDSNIIISMTDPPLLNYWAGLLSERKKIPWVYWAIDIYPYAYRAARLAGENNFIYHHLDKSFRKHVPSFLIALGEAQAEFLQKHWIEPVPQVVLPCGIQHEAPKRERPLWRKNDGRIYFAYAGNMGEPHDPEFLLDIISRLDERHHRCILALYGSKAHRIIRKAQNNPAVEIVPYVGKDEMSYIDVHLVNLLPEWTHVSVPSKAVSAICAGQTILFNGLEASDTWQMFQDAGWLITEFEDRQERRKEIEEVLSGMSNSALAEKKKNATHIREKLLHMQDAAFTKIADWIRSI